MAKRASKPANPPATAEQLLTFEARLAVLEELCRENDAGLSAQHGRLHELRGELEKALGVALEAQSQSQDALETRQLARSHEDRLTNLTLAVAEGIAHVERAEARIRATVQRARQQLAEAGVESPALEAEGAELQFRDEQGSGGRRLHAVPEDVERLPPGVEVAPRPDDHRPSAIPGMTRGQLRKLRGG